MTIVIRINVIYETFRPLCISTVISSIEMALMH